MSRQISQSNISSYFMKSVDEDLSLFRNVSHLHISKELERLDSCLTGICVGGQLDFELFGRPYSIKKDQIFCLMPGFFVEFKSVTPDFRVHYSLISRNFVRDITSRFPNVMFDFLASNPSMNMTEKAMSEAMDYINLIEAKLTEKNNLFQKDILFNILYSHLLDMYNMVIRYLPDYSLGKTANEKIFDRFSVLFDNKLKENLPVSFYAEALNITPKHLSKVVKMVKGVSVKKYMNEKMVYALKRALISDMYGIAEISDMFSFSSPDVMHHFFRKQVGMSPSAFRSRNHK